MRKESNNKKRLGRDSPNARESGVLLDSSPLQYPQSPPNNGNCQFAARRSGIRERTLIACVKNKDLASVHEDAVVSCASSGGKGGGFKNPARKCGSLQTKQQSTWRGYWIRAPSPIGVNKDRLPHGPSWFACMTVRS